MFPFDDVIMMCASVGRVILGLRSYEGYKGVELYDVQDMSQNIHQQFRLKVI